MGVVPLIRGEPAARTKRGKQFRNESCKPAQTWTERRKGGNERVLNLAITKSTQLTPVQASNTYIQMSGDRGFRKEKTPGLVPLGLR